MIWSRLIKIVMKRSCGIWDHLLWINCWRFRVVCLEKGSNSRYLTSATGYIDWEEKEWEGRVEDILAILSLRYLETFSEWEKHHHSCDGQGTRRYRPNFSVCRASSNSTPKQFSSSLCLYDRNIHPETPGEV